MNKRKYLELYNKILFIRLVEEEIAKRYSDQEMRCPVHLSIGQEAQAVAICQYLKKKDIMFSSHRSHAHYLAKNCDPYKMISELHGKEDGCLNGIGGSMHLQDISNYFFGSLPIVGSAIGLAIGTSFNQKRKSSKNITVVFIGDGTMEEGIAHEALNMSSIFNLPILFVCENNYFSIYTHIESRQPSDDMTRIAKAHKVQSLRTNAINLVNFLNQTKKVISYIKKNKKPFFLQIDTYRAREHCGPNFDDHLNYRKNKEKNFWFKNDALKKFEEFLNKKNFLNKSKKEIFIKNNKEKIFTLFTKARKAKFSNPSISSQNIYAE